MKPLRCPRHDRRLVFEDTTEAVHIEGGREVFTPVRLFVCPERGCNERRVAA